MKTLTEEKKSEVVKNIRQSIDDESVFTILTEYASGDKNVPLERWIILLTRTQKGAAFRAELEKALSIIDPLYDNYDNVDDLFG